MELLRIPAQPGWVIEYWGNDDDTLDVPLVLPVVEWRQYRTGSEADIDDASDWMAVVVNCGPYLTSDTPLHVYDPNRGDRFCARLASGPEWKSFTRVNSYWSPDAFPKSQQAG
jgi:hypothetical protein